MIDIGGRVVLMLAFMKLLWRSWKKIVHGINGAISFTLMSVAYILGLGPVAIYFKLTRADLMDRGLAGELESYWLALPPDEDDVRRVQRPW